MGRLTKKQGNVYYPTNESYLIPDDGSNAARLLQVIGEYENLEEELGIDLITLFKALKDGIYVDLNGFVKLISINDLSLKFYIKRWYLGFYHSLNGGTFYVDLKDYKKTWALCKEDLENG